MNPLQQLRAIGMSMWLDTLSRDLLDTGHLGSLISDWSVTGATSNPTIFAAAMGDSDRYDTQLRQLANSGVRDPQELFFQLALDDVKRAADLLRPTYESTGGTDGFVSFQCTPDLADDTDGTVTQALALWHRLNRPNVMIKVPATPASVPAIAELTARGVNVNVTLLFSVGRYDQVIGAFQQGLARRLAGGRLIDSVTSVASFFVSRVDTKVDPQLPPGSGLLGRTAVANAQHAHHQYRRRLRAPSWLRLRAAGGRPQRPLWASTATKDARYSDVKYVEELIAPDTIITSPEGTLRAFADHGRVTHMLPDTLPDDVLTGLAAHGVDLGQVTTQLEHEGVSAFRHSYQQLLDHLDTRAAQLTGTGAGTSSAAPAVTHSRHQHTRTPSRRRYETERQKRARDPH